MEKPKNYTTGSLFDKDSYVVKKRVRNHISLVISPEDYTDILFQHSVLCQTSLPYRNQGNEILWVKKQRNLTLMVQCLATENEQGEQYYPGLPYGSRARLILYYINSMARKQKSDVVEVGSSLTNFIKRLGIPVKGENVDAVKEQLLRLNNSVITWNFNGQEFMGNKKQAFVQDYIIAKGDHDISLFSEINQRNFSDKCLIKLDPKYYQDLCEHSIPLDERAINALANNSRALDVYTWLAYRLCKIPENDPMFISWKAIKDQFGDNYKRMDQFKERFRQSMDLVKLNYPAAKIEEEHNKGFTLYKSDPPIVEKKTFSLTV